MLKKISLRFKLLGTFLAISLLLAVCGGIGLHAMDTVVDKYDVLSTNSLPNILTVGRMRYRVQELHRSLLDSLMATDKVHFDEDHQAFTESLDVYNDLNKKYMSVPFLPGEDAVYRISANDWTSYSALATKVFDRMKNGDTKTADFKEQVEKQIPLLFKNLDMHLEDVLQFHEKYASTVEEDAHHRVRFAFALVSLVVGFGFCISMSLGFLLSHSLTKVLTGISHAVHTSAIETNSASFQLSTASQQLSSGASSVATSLEETVASLEELSSMVTVNSSHAKEANTLSQRSKEAAEKGETEINRLISAMHEIASGSKKIEDIISVIDDIAFQTNLLALNAAVEAARAGEQGKGFAVVADAVRTLSQRSASAAKDISNLIKDNVSKSEGGAKIAEASGAVLTDIVTNVKKVADLNTGISSASEAQSQGLEQISKAMNHLDHATQENASSSEEVAAASEEMSGQARHLMVMVQDLQSVIFGEGNIPQTTAKIATKVATKLTKKMTTKVTGKKSTVAVKKETAQNVIPFPGEKSEAEGSDRKLAKVNGF